MRPPRTTLASLALLACLAWRVEPAPVSPPGPASATGSFRWETPAGPVLIGSPFEVVGAVESPDPLELLAPVESQDTGPFKILAAEMGPPEPRGGASTQPLRLRLTAFDIGEQTLPELRWRLRGPDGAERTLTSPPLRVTLSSPAPGPGDTGDIRDIKGPLVPRLWPWALLAALLLLTAGAAGFRRWRRSRRPVEIGGFTGPSDTRTPEQIALDELDALLGQGLPVKEYYDRVSDILRLYIERRCGLLALSMTTHDLQRRLIAAQIDPEARALTKSLLDRCDLAKFARFIPGEPESRSDCETAKRIVRMLSAAPPGGAANVGGAVAVSESLHGEDTKGGKANITTSPPQTLASPRGGEADLEANS
ncbi:MAG: hypothetical protein ABII00_02745 [Elusimicrobiota bacterium]